MRARQPQQQPPRDRVQQEQQQAGSVEFQWRAEHAERRPQMGTGDAPDRPAPQPGKEREPGQR